MELQFVIILLIVFKLIWFVLIISLFVFKYISLVLILWFTSNIKLFLNDITFINFILKVLRVWLCKELLLLF